MQFTGHWNAIPIARNLAVRFQALKQAYLLVQRQKGAILTQSAKALMDAGVSILTRIERLTVPIHGKQRPLNGDMTLLRWATDLSDDERKILKHYSKVTAELPGSQALRVKFNPICLGFRVVFGDPLFFTLTPDRRHSKLVWRLMRCRREDTSLLAADEVTAWRQK